MAKIAPIEEFLQKELDSVPRYRAYTFSMEETINKSMTIGTLAKSAGVGVETVRFYQRKGLLDTPERTSGFRKYNQSDLKRIRFVKRVQQLGFSLKEAQEFLDLAICSSETRPILAKSCEEKIGQIEQKIADLNRMLELLGKFSQICGNDALNDSECNLLDCFENNWKCCENLTGEKND